MNKKTVNFLLYVAASLIVAGSFYIYSQAEEVKNYPPKNDTIALFGDSLAAGYGSSDGLGLSSILSKKIGKPVLNFGKYGDTTADGLARVDTVLAANPGIVMILFGGNDFLQGVPKGEAFKNLRTMVEIFQSRGSAVIILGIRGGLLVDSYEESFRELAEETKSLYVSDVLAGILHNRNFMHDPVHPNDYGYAYIAAKIQPELGKLLR